MNNRENNIKNSENGNELREINTKSVNELKKYNGYNQVKKEKEVEPENDTEKLSQSLKNLILFDKEFSEPVVIKKENKILTDFHYATFKNSYGENTCYINVVLHILYNIEQLQDFIISLYSIDELNKKSYTSKSYKITPEETSETYKFLVLIGKILYEYKEIIWEESDSDNPKKVKNQVTIINTFKMRKMLEKVSKNQFQLNTIADPVELLSFILDILTEYLNEDIHRTFYLELIDEYTCDKKGCSQINNKYDKDNFMYHIYIDEILKYIEKENLKVNDYKNKLFEFSHNLFLSENTKICEKCKEKMNHNLICKNMPDYILINCVWKESNPIVDDAMTIFFMMPIKDEFNKLFISQTKTYKIKLYHLFGFVLYSFTLSHYVICIYNIDKNVFVLLNDETVKEFNNLYELLIDITVDELESNGKAFFYPVMLIYTKDTLYHQKNLRINTLNDSEYKIIINQCNEAIYKYEMKNKTDEETEENNYKEFIKKQQEIENEIKRSIRYESNLKKRKAENNLENQNKEIKQKINFVEEKKNDNDNYKDNKKNINEEKKILNNDIKKVEIDNDNKKDIKEEKKILKEDIKKGLDEKNKYTIGKILKDMKDKGGKDFSSNLYIGDFIKSKNIINNEDKNINNNQNKIRNNYLYQSNIKWINKTIQEKNEIQNRENKLDINNNKSIYETSLNPKSGRFHRKTNTELTNNNKNNLRYEGRYFKDNDFKSNIGVTNISGRYHYYMDSENQ